MSLWRIKFFKKIWNAQIRWW